MDTKAKKKELRQQLLADRGSLSEEEFLEKSDQIISQLTKHSVFKKANRIHCYVSLNNRREVNTHPLIKQILNGEKEAVVPVTNMENGTLRHVKLNDFNELTSNNWGVLEPSSSTKEVEVDSLDLIIVPMVGGDHQKNRIGYGKGFYDRFLEKVECPAVGLLFESCVVQEVPVEPFDVPLTMLITEQRIIS